MSRAKRKPKKFNFKFKPKYILIAFVCFLSIGYAALNVSLFIEGHFSIAKDDDANLIYLSFVAVNTDYVYKDNLSTDNLEIDEDQMNFIFSTNILNAEDNVIAYRIMNRATQYDITNTHVMCSDSDNYTFTDVSQGETVSAQSYLDSNIVVDVSTVHEETISCVFTFDLVERTTLADTVELEETPQIQYDAYQVAYEYDGIDEIHTVGDALDYIYKYLN